MNAQQPPPRSRRRRLWRGLLYSAAILIVAAAGRCLYAFRDRNPGYSVAITIEGRAALEHPRPFQAGFGRVRINPDLSDPRRPVWLAGFGAGRAATALHDDLWAVACAMDDGQTRLGVVVLDAIGLFHDQVIAVRRRVPAAAKFDYVIVCTTHNHSTPDLMGLWGPNHFRTGVDRVYLEQVIAAAAQALGEAASALQPARIAWHEIPMPSAGLVADTRKPEVFDPDLRVLHFTHPGDGRTLGTIVGWANHPETVWSKNTEITADFCGYLREALEQGVRHEGILLEAGLGGLHLYINGAIGGLLTTAPGVTVRDPYLQQDHQKPSHEKARAVGRQLAAQLLPRLKDTNVAATAQAPIDLRARTIEVPIDNALFLLAPVLGVIDRGQVRWKTLRTEVALVTVGEAAIACVPGEIYPEIVNGGVERAPGGDFDLDPVEVPPLRELMPGRVKFVFGLANDEIGYLIPKSQWDRRPPYLYGSPKRVYGEINSVGPEAAVRIHAALAELCRAPR